MSCLHSWSYKQPPLDTLAHQAALEGHGLCVCHCPICPGEQMFVCMGRPLLASIFRCLSLLLISPGFWAPALPIPLTSYHELFCLLWAWPLPALPPSIPLSLPPFIYLSLSLFLQSGLNVLQSFPSSQILSCPRVPS